MVETDEGITEGEYQPIYDEFSSCLLFLLALVHRYNLQSDNLGLDPGPSFLRQLLKAGGINESIPVSELTKDQDHQLGDWLRNLFETEGISDELMSSCSPH